MSGRARHRSLPGGLLGAGEAVADVEASWPVTETATPYTSAFIDVRVDTVSAPDGTTLSRTTVEHPGAVGIVAIDDDGHILMLEQYRHPVRRRLFEVPAGLLDVEGESARDAAARELAEEADLVAARWDRLATVYSSPGFTDERIEIFAARELSEVAPEDRTPRAAEEADMTMVWVPLAEAVRAVLGGRIGNHVTATGVLAVHVMETSTDA